jgi:hypothetical protein
MENPPLIRASYASLNLGTTNLPREAAAPDQGGRCGTRPDIAKDFVPGGAVMKTFRRYLDKEKIPYTENAQQQ